MKTIIVEKSNIDGVVNMPPSKSISHRALISAALSNGESKIDNLIFSKDMDATIGCLENIGVKFEKSKNSIIVKGVKNVLIKDEEFQCNESGSTIRFMIPIALIDKLNEFVVFDGRGKLVLRPLEPYLNIFKEKKINYEYNGKLPLKISGNLESGYYELPGDVSSQFVTGLMFALTKVKGDSVIRITSELESKNYVDLTIDVLKKYGVNIKNNEYREFEITGEQEYKSFDYFVEGDFSQSAFFIVAGIINGDIKISGLNKNTLQGDKEIINIVKKMGADVYFESDKLIVKKSITHGIDIDVSNIPDLVPILAVLAVYSKGVTRIYNGMRVRLKESDRIKACFTELKKLGADIIETEDGLIIKGTGKLKSGEVNSWNDHRIVMAMAVAALNCEKKIKIEDYKAINKSYPHFFEDLKKLGGKINE